MSNGTTKQGPLHSCCNCYEDATYPAEDLRVHKDDVWCDCCWDEYRWDGENRPEFYELERFVPEHQSRITQLEQTNATHKEHIQMLEKHRQEAFDKAEALAGELGRLKKVEDIVFSNIDCMMDPIETVEYMTGLLAKFCDKIYPYLSQVADSKEGESSVMKGTDRTTSGAIGQP